jgi:hypothetical protein
MKVRHYPVYPSLVPLASLGRKQQKIKGETFSGECRGQHPHVCHPSYANFESLESRQLANIDMAAPVTIFL